MRTPAAPLTDLDVIAQRLRDELTAHAPSESEALRTIAQLESDGSWPDVDYADRARTHWSPHQHTRRLAQLAAADSAQGPREQLEALEVARQGLESCATRARTLDKIGMPRRSSPSTRCLGACK